MRKYRVSNVLNIIFIDQNLFILKILCSLSYCFLKYHFLKYKSLKKIKHEI